MEEVVEHERMELEIEQCFHEREEEKPVNRNEVLISRILLNMSPVCLIGQSYLFLNILWV